MELKGKKNIYCGFSQVKLFYVKFGARMNRRLFALVLPSASTVIPFVPPVHKYLFLFGVWLAHFLCVLKNQTVINK